MIKKKYRLGADFFTSQNIYTQHKDKIVLPGAHIFFFPSDNNYSRYACVLKKQLFSSHVSKNQFKRSFFSLIQQKNFHTQITGKNIIVIIKQPTEKTLQDITEVLSTLL